MTAAELATKLEKVTAEQLDTVWGGMRLLDDIRQAAARLRALEEALQPSAATKSAYIGEIKDDVKAYDQDGDEYYYEHTISWTAVKAVMAMISARAALAKEGE